MTEISLHDGIRDYWFRYLRRQPHRVYAVLDAARDPRVGRLVRDCMTYEPLIVELPDVSPYLVEATSRDLERLVYKTWGEGTGIFVTSSASRQTVVDHLQSLLEVQTAYGEHVLFRFYDPRVLRAFVPVCTRDEIDELLGPLDRMLVEARLPTSALEVTHVERQPIGVAA